MQACIDCRYNRACAKPALRNGILYVCKIFAGILLKVSWFAFALCSPSSSTAEHPGCVRTCFLSARESAGGEPSRWGGDDNVHFATIIVIIVIIIVILVIITAWSSFTFRYSHHPHMRSDPQHNNNYTVRQQNSDPKHKIRPRRKQLVLSRKTAEAWKYPGTPDCNVRCGIYFLVPQNRAEAMRFLALKHNVQVVGLSYIGWVFYASRSVHTGKPNSKSTHWNRCHTRKQLLPLCCFYSVRRVSAHDAA